jgi:hypothetical protein
VAIKINTETWAIKVNRRSFYKHHDGGVVTLNTKREAVDFAHRINATGTLAEPARVKVRIEEIE